MIIGVDQESEDDDVVVVEDNISLLKKAKKHSSLIKPAFSSSSGSINIWLGALSMKNGESLHDIVQRRMDEK